MAGRRRRCQGVCTDRQATDVDYRHLGRLCYIGNVITEEMAQKEFEEITPPIEVFCRQLVCYNLGSVKLEFEIIG